MSYDLAVWHQPSKISNEDAGEIYAALCEEDLSGVSPYSKIEAFYTELTSKHPEIADISDDDIDNHDLCPWSCAFDRSPGHLIMCCVWPKAEYVADLVFNLAAEHELAVFDPQSESINFPQNQVDSSDLSKPWWRFLGLTTIRRRTRRRSRRRTRRLIKFGSFHRRGSPLTFCKKMHRITRLLFADFMGDHGISRSEINQTLEDLGQQVDNLGRFTTFTYEDGTRLNVQLCFYPDDKLHHVSMSISIEGDEKGWGGLDEGQRAEAAYQST